ncbi:MAG: DUF2069 domain-containing protein [Moraxellaceae bacterium]|nr:MAG: DUF2069 domain-containing protein [Moraxellaceae bacterium]
MKKNSVIPSRANLESALITVGKKLQPGLWITHGSYIIFLLLMSWLNFQIANGGVTSSTIKLWFVKVIPLLIFVPGLLKKRYRTYSWLCFAILPYFIWITPLVVGRGDWSDWTLVSLIVIIFIGAMMTSRWLQQESYLRWQITQTPVSDNA